MSRKKQAKLVQHFLLKHLGSNYQQLNFVDVGQSALQVVTDNLLIGHLLVIKKRTKLGRFFITEKHGQLSATGQDIIKTSQDNSTYKHLVKITRIITENVAKNYQFVEHHKIVNFRDNYHLGLHWLELFLKLTHTQGIITNTQLNFNGQFLLIKPSDIQTHLVLKKINAHRFMVSLKGNVKPKAKSKLKLYLKYLIALAELKNNLPTEF